MASNGGFEGDVGAVEREMLKIAAHSKKIASNLENASTTFVNFSRSVAKTESKMGDIARKMERLNELGDKNGFDKLRKSMKGLATERNVFRFLDNLSKGVDKVFSGLAKLGGGIIAETFDFLISGIKRVYELQERWTRAIGGFNMKIGGMTSGLKQAQRAATQWSGTIRGLTNGDITEGIQMFEEYTYAMSRVVMQGDQFSKFGLQLARGFNLGGAGAGKLASTFEDMGASAMEATSTMSELIDAANLVGIPVNQLTEDVVEANTYMARFGKEGAKGFVTGAAYARKFAMSMRELQAATEKFDLFDDAATTASKLNSTFGTLINSVDLMLMDDPAQRIEYLRQQFLAQGKTFDTLSVKERRFAAETMGVNDQQLATLLSLKDANVSYLDITAKQRAHEATDAQAKKRMEVQLRKTAQTMYAFGAAFDRITLAIAKAIKPLLVVLGLAKSGDKDFKSFGQVMESVTQHIIHFFESLAGNDKWQTLMRKLATGMKEVGAAVSSFIMSGKAAELAGDLAEAMSDVYDFGRKAFLFMIDAGKRLEPVLKFVASHVKEIAFAWAAWQGAKFAGGVVQGARSAKSMIPKWKSNTVGTGATAAEFSARSGSDSNGINWGSATGSPFENEALSEQLSARARVDRRGRMMRGLKIAGGAGLMAGAGTFLSGGNMGESIGSGVGTAGGTALGMALGGPLGGAIGGAIGEFVGKRLGNSLFSLFKPGESALDKSRRHLQETMDDSAKSLKRHASIIDLVREKNALEGDKRSAMTARLNNLEEQAVRTKGVHNQLSGTELSDLQVRIIQMKKLGISSAALDTVLRDSLNPTVDLTDKQIKLVADKSAVYEKTISNLNEQSNKLFEIEKLKLESSNLAINKKQMEMRSKEMEINLQSEKDLLKKFQSGNREVDLDEKTDKEFGAFFAKRAKTLAPDITMGGATMKGRMTDDVRRQINKEFQIQKQKQKITNMEIDLGTMKEKSIRAGMDLDKRMFLLEARHLITQDVRYLEFKKMMLAGNANLSENNIFQSFLGQNQKEFRGLYGEDFGGLMSGGRAMASGGIVRSPTRALIGENGPEAVIPLRAIARGGRLGRGGGLRSAVTNMVASSAGHAGGGTSLHVVTSNVILDGNKVGRAITQIALSSPGA